MSATAAGHSYVSRLLMPTTRFSIRSMRPTPCRPAKSPTLVMSFAGDSRSPFTETG